jgi:hypothetical protein
VVCWPRPGWRAADPLGLRDARDGTGLISNSHLASTPAARYDPERLPDEKRTPAWHHDRTVGRVFFSGLRAWHGCSWRVTGRVALRAAAGRLRDLSSPSCVAWLRSSLEHFLESLLVFG